MSIPVPRQHLCSFCAKPPAEVRLLFASERGGLPPLICDECVKTFCAVATVHERSPGLAEALVAAHNAGVARERGGR